MIATSLKLNRFNSCKQNNYTTVRNTIKWRNNEVGCAQRGIHAAASSCLFVNNATAVLVKVVKSFTCTHENRSSAIVIYPLRVSYNYLIE